MTQIRRLLVQLPAWHAFERPGSVARRRRGRIGRRRKTHFLYVNGEDGKLGGRQSAWNDKWSQMMVTSSEEDISPGHKSSVRYLIISTAHATIGLCVTSAIVALPSPSPPPSYFLLSLVFLAWERDSKLRWRGFLFRDFSPKKTAISPLLSPATKVVTFVARTTSHEHSHPTKTNNRVA